MVCFSFRGHILIAIVPLLWGMHFYASRDYMHPGAIAQQEYYSMRESSPLRYGTLVLGYACTVNASRDYMHLEAISHLFSLPAMGSGTSTKEKSFWLVVAVLYIHHKNYGTLFMGYAFLSISGLYASRGHILYFLFACNGQCYMHSKRNLTTIKGFSSRF